MKTKPVPKEAALELYSMMIRPLINIYNLGGKYAIVGDLMFGKQWVETTTIVVVGTDNSAKLFRDLERLKAQNVIAPDHDGIWTQTLRHFWVVGSPGKLHITMHIGSRNQYGYIAWWQTLRLQAKQFMAKQGKPYGVTFKEYSMSVRGRTPFFPEIEDVSAFLNMPVDLRNPTYEYYLGRFPRQFNFAALRYNDDEAPPTQLSFDVN